jgi:hypothetical protein
MTIFCLRGPRTGFYTVGQGCAAAKNECFSAKPLKRHLGQLPGLAEKQHWKRAIRLREHAQGGYLSRRSLLM